MTEARLVDDLMRRCQRYKQRIAELEAQLLEAQQHATEFAALLELQPCGHPRACVRVGEEVAPGQFVHHCGVCAEIEAARWEERERQRSLADRIADIRAQIESHPSPLQRYRK